MSQRMAARVLELSAERVPFVHATVVRAQVPSSARAGDDAVVLQDGTIEGFVGGQCAETSVRTAALGALQDGRTVLLRVLPDDTAPFPDSPGATVVVNECLSGGALEIFLQPMLPAPLIEVVGRTPVAEAVLAIAGILDYATARSVPGAIPENATAVVVASHGRDEQDAITAALAAGVPYIALVASRKRGTAVLDELGLTGEQRARVRTPAGLDLGSRTAAEVALSIVAEVVQTLRSADRPVLPVTPLRPRTAIDPVCGMTVTVMPDTPHLAIDGTDHWFCNPGCRDQYAAQLRGGA
jgi:xanthine dehydrogenase accessory factor